MPQPPRPCSMTLEHIQCFQRLSTNQFPTLGSLQASKVVPPVPTTGARPFTACPLAPFTGQVPSRPTTGHTEAPLAPAVFDEEGRTMNCSTKPDAQGEGGEKNGRGSPC